MCYTDERLTFIRRDPRFWRDTIEIKSRYQAVVATNAKRLHLKDQGNGLYTIQNGRDSESTIQAVESVMDIYDTLMEGIS